MAPSVLITQSTGESFRSDNLTTYSITENASPLTPLDTTGGATTIQFGVGEFEESMLLGGGELTVLDGDQALVQGKIDGPSSDGTVVSITGYSVISKLNVVKPVAPYKGTLEGFVTQLLVSVGVTRPVTVDASIAGRQVLVHGFKENLLAVLKEFLAVQGVELADRGDAVYLRAPRQRLISARDMSKVGTSTDLSQLSQSLELTNWRSSYETNDLIYPEATYDDSTGIWEPAGWKTDTPILTVEANATTVVEVPILGSLFSVEQPACVKTVGPVDGANGSMYTVIGQGTNTDSGNGSTGSAASVETLDPDTWERLGGSVTVAVGENFDTLVITIKSGDNEPTLAPFAIAMNAGNGTYYSSLRVRGTGIIDHPVKLTYQTGLGAEDTSIEASTVTSKHIQNRDLADRVAVESLPRIGAPIITLTGKLAHPGQPIGELAGARFRYGDAYYRITTAVSAADGVAVTAVSDTTIDDFDDLWADLTFDDFDAVWELRTDTQFSAAPLRSS